MRPAEVLRVGDNLHFKSQAIHTCYSNIPIALIRPFILPPQHKLDEGYRF